MQGNEWVQFPRENEDASYCSSSCRKKRGNYRTSWCRNREYSLACLLENRPEKVKKWAWDRRFYIAGSRLSHLKLFCGFIFFYIFFYYIFNPRLRNTNNRIYPKPAWRENSSLSLGIGFDAKNFPIFSDPRVSVAKLFWNDEKRITIDLPIVEQVTKFIQRK